MKSALSPILSKDTQVNRWVFNYGLLSIKISLSVSHKMNARIYVINIFYTYQNYELKNLFAEKIFYFAIYSSEGAVIEVNL